MSLPPASHYSPQEATKLLGTPFRTLLKKEVMRFLSVYVQTIITPLISASLYLVIFGLSLGDRISFYGDVPYTDFLIPGLVMMAIVNNAFANTSSSIFISKYLGNIIDILIVPLRSGEIVLAYTLGGMARGLIVGILVALISRPFASTPLAHPLLAASFAALACALFSLFGILAAIWAERFDDLSIFNTFIILPLTYLGGIFYSVEILPPLFAKLSYLNPILYLIGGLRHGFLGLSDINPYPTLLALAAAVALLFYAVVRVVESGYKLKT